MFRSMWGGIFWGLVVGAGAALLFAPQSGVETRNLIAAKSKDAKDRASGMASSASQKAQFMSEKIKQAI